MVTTTNFSPYREIREQGITKTWSRKIKFPDRLMFAISVLKNTGIIESFLIKKLEKNRWRKTGLFYSIIYSLFSCIFRRNVSFEITSDNYFIEINAIESHSTMGHKFIASMSHAFENGYDYLVLSNSSSYLNTDEIRNYLNRLNSNDNFYGGRPMHDFKNKSNSASGSFVVISKETIASILRIRHLWMHGFLDDIALSHMIKKLKIGFTQLNSIDIKSSNQIIARVQNGSPILHYKVGYWGKSAYEDRIDIEIMHKLNLFLS